MAATGIQRRLRGWSIALGGFHHDGNLAFDQLGVGGLNVDHQVAVDLAAADHRPGGDHVQHQLLCGSGLQAGRAGHHFRADNRCNGDVGAVRHFAVRIAADDRDQRVLLVGVGHCAQHVRRTAAGGNADQNVMLVKAQRL